MNYLKAGTPPQRVYHSHVEYQYKDARLFANHIQELIDNIQQYNVMNDWLLLENKYGWLHGSLDSLTFKAPALIVSTFHIFIGISIFLLYLPLGFFFTCFQI